MVRKNSKKQSEDKPDDESDLFITTIFPISNKTSQFKTDQPKSTKSFSRHFKFNLVFKLYEGCFDAWWFCRIGRVGWSKFVWGLVVLG